MGEGAGYAGEGKAVVDMLKDAAVFGAQQVFNEVGDVASAASVTHVADAGGGFGDGGGLVVAGADAPGDAGGAFVGEKGGELRPVHGGLGDQIDLWAD